MSQFPLGFTKCPNCQKYSINIVPAFGYKEEKLVSWQCPYCFTLLSEDDWKKNMIEEISEDIEKEHANFLFGQVLIYDSEEITPEKARELAIKYIKGLETKKFPPSFENIRISDYKEEWWIDFDKIAPKGLSAFPPTYCVIVNKKTGEINLIGGI